MTRVATIPLQQSLSNAITRSQKNLSTSHLQLTNGKKANDYAGLGIDAVRTLSARSMLSQQLSYQTVTTRISTTLSLYDANISQVDDAMANMRQELMNALGTRNSPGLQSIIESSFKDVRAALNASEAGIPLFGGSQIDTLPFVPTDLAEFAAMNPDDVFLNDDVRLSSRIADGVDMEYGVGASQVATGLLPAFKTLADAGPFGEFLTDDEMAAIRKALTEIDAGLVDVRSVNAENGRKQNQAQVYLDRAVEREILMTKVIGQVEDADLAQVAFDLAQRKTILEASYSVFAQLSTLSLARYLD